MITLETITPTHALAFKVVRLRALQDSPTAFGSTYAEQSQFSDAEWLRRAAHCTTATSIAYLAMDDRTPVGMARATPDDHDPSIAWLESMWVDPSQRRSGVGRHLAEGIIAWARSRGLRVLKLSVTSNNQPAIRFYEAMGFSPIGKTEPYPNDPTLVECEMARLLNDPS